MTNDINPFFAEYGAGEALVLLHGNGESSDIFSSLAKMYANNFHVFAPDSRGHGKTARGIKPLTLVQCANDLYMWLCEKGITKINLLGFSDGANIAMLFAIKHPDMITKMILNSGNLTPSGLNTRLIWNFRLSYLKLNVKRLIYKKSSDAYASLTHRIELLRLMVCEPHISKAQLARFDIPVLVIAGENDLIRRKHTDMIARAIPNSSILITPGNHDVCIADPVLFYENTIRFLM